MVQSATGTILGADMSEMVGVPYGTMFIETREGERLNFQITKETEGSVPPIGSMISVEYVGDEIYRAVKIEIIQASGERKNLFLGLPSSRDKPPGTALQRGLIDMLLIVVFQATIGIEYMFLGSQFIILGEPAWLTYLYLVIGLIHLIIAAGLYLMQSWSYAASLTFTLLSALFLGDVVILILSLVVIVYLIQERVRGYYEYQRGD